MSEVFADGEPVDPIKLQKLQDQINEISKKADNAFELSNRTLDGATTSYVYHTKGGVEEFSNVASGKLYSSQIDVTWSADYDQFYTTATPVLNDSSYQDIRISLKGSAAQPSIVVYYLNSKNKSAVIETLKIHWISVARKPLSN